MQPLDQHPRPASPFADYDYLKRETFRLTGIQLDFYKEGQMRRRIDTLITRKGLSSYADFVRHLEGHPEDLDYYTHYVTINVTEFFRDTLPWQMLQEDIIPQLIERFGPRLRVWSAASSTGEEPYSLAMALSRYVPLEQIHVIATDIDDKVLNTARAGIYLPEALANIPEDLQQRFFLPAGDRMRISDELKRCVEFRHLDLHLDDYPQDCHLIACRNVLIYFTPDAKETIFQKFRDCGAPGSCLFLGKAEQIVNWKHLGYLRERPCFYFQ